MDGFPFLASCRQVRDGGRDFFFASNRFILPAGNLDDFRSWMKSLMFKGRLPSISMLAAELSLADIRPQQIEKLCGDAVRCDRVPTKSHRRNCTCVWNKMAEYYLRHVWGEKLTFINSLGQIRRIEEYGEVTGRIRTAGDDPFAEHDENGAHLFEDYSTDRRILNNYVEFLRSELRSTEGPPITWKDTANQICKDGRHRNEALKWCTDLQDGKIIKDRKALFIAVPR